MTHGHIHLLQVSLLGVSQSLGEAEITRFIHSFARSFIHGTKHRPSQASFKALLGVRGGARMNILNVMTTWSTALSMKVTGKRTSHQGGSRLTICLLLAGVLV